MIDKMYLQKAGQNQNGEYVGVNENGDLYKGILVFMIVNTLCRPSNPRSHVYWQMVINKNIRVLVGTH